MQYNKYAHIVGFLFIIFMIIINTLIEFSNLSLIKKKKTKLDSEQDN